MLIECAEFIILKWRGVERNDGWDLAEPTLGENGRHLRVEEQGVKSGLPVDAGDLTARTRLGPAP